MFPSETYKELCIENQEVLREEWEPRVGDWIVLKHQPSKPYLVVLTYPSLLISLGAVSEGVLQSECVPLFQPRQLIEMLEERGERWAVSRIYSVGSDREDAYGATAISSAFHRKGPDPATALLKAYLSLDPVGEVVKEEKR